VRSRRALIGALAVTLALSLPSGARADDLPPWCGRTGHASGINLSWGTACWSDPGHSDFLPMACDADTGRTSLTVSIRLDHHMTGVSGITVELFAASIDEVSPLPDWWHVGSVGGCRSGALGVSADFSPAPNVGCTSLWTSLPRGGVVGCYMRDDAHLGLEFSYDAMVPVTLSAGTEYYVGRVEIGHAKTIGPGACAGCATPVFWAPRWVWLYRSALDYEYYDGGLGNLCIATGPATVPVRGPTWGMIKGLYRSGTARP
jgi:hypothetical protein